MANDIITAKKNVLDAISSAKRIMEELLPTMRTADKINRDALKPGSGTGSGGFTDLAIAARAVTDKADTAKPTVDSAIRAVNTFLGEFGPEPEVVKAHKAMCEIMREFSDLHYAVAMQIHALRNAA